MGQGLHGTALEVHRERDMGQWVPCVRWDPPVQRKAFPLCPGFRLWELSDLCVVFCYRMWFPTVKNWPKRIRNSCLIWWCSINRREASRLWARKSERSWKLISTCFIYCRQVAPGSGVDGTDWTAQLLCIRKHHLQISVELFLISTEEGQRAVLSLCLSWHFLYFLTYMHSNPST